jgi:ERF superfamily
MAEGQEVIEHGGNGNGVVPAADPVTLLQMIGSLAARTDIPIERVERLIALQERMEDRAAAAEYNIAMSAAQAEMEPIRADLRNKQTSSKYASHAALDRAIRPIYSKHGLSLSFDTADVATADTIRVVCKITHKSHVETPHLDVPADGKGAKGGDVMTKTHAMGSAVSYGIRILIRMVFNLAIFGMKEDDDGNAAGATALITEEQVRELSQLITSTKSDLDAFLKFFKIGALPELPTKRLQQALKMLQTKAKRATDGKGAKK